MLLLCCPLGKQQSSWLLLLGKKPLVEEAAWARSMAEVTSSERWMWMVLIADRKPHPGGLGSISEGSEVIS